ncbi:MAG: hypothetical protein LBN00_03510 [Oscillospiraceae bacterium]|jgi:hypothetical protein|nr:hypothetical protein [Oscillospiraceae bacterium]
MSKVKSFFIAVIILGLIVGLYAGINSDVSLSRAIAKTLREFDSRVSSSAFTVIKAAYEYPKVDIAVDYAGVHATAKIYADDTKISVGGGIFGDKAYGITHNLGAELDAFIELIADLKPEFTENADTGNVTATCHFNDEKYGATTAVFTIIRRRLTVITASANGLDAVLDLGADANDDWTLTVNGETYSWRIDRADKYNRDWLTFGEHTIITYWDARSDFFGLRIDNLQASGILAANRNDFRLQLDGSDGFTLALSGAKNTESSGSIAPEFIDIGDDYEAFGDIMWAAVGTLYR